MDLVTIIVAMAISGILTSTMVSMAMMPIKTQKQKTNFAAAEAAAIAIRKGVANNAAVFDSDAKITTANITAQNWYKDLNISGDLSCSVVPSYNPPGSRVVVPYAAVCKQGRDSDNLQGVAWQPLYTVRDFTEQTTAGTTTPAQDLSACLTSMVKLTAPATDPKDSPWSPDLSAVPSCKGINITFNDSANYNAARVLCRITVEMDGKAANRYTGTGRFENSTNCP